MSNLTDRIIAAEGWAELDDAAVAARLGEAGPPLALLFIGRGGSRRETADLAVVLRDLARSRRVRPAVCRGIDRGIVRRFGIVAMPSLVLATAASHRVIPLIADWSAYAEALAALTEEMPA